MRLDLRAADDLTTDERAQLAALTAAVYPPEVNDDRPGRRIVWAPPQWHVIVRQTDARILSTVGVVLRKARLDGIRLVIGGIGSVKTHPELRGRGLATMALRRAGTFLHDDCGAAFSLLVCREPLVAFYARHGWTLFDGILLVQQPQGTVRFTENRPMVLPARSEAPRTGALDLQGPPW